jgi:hypothetical protein
MQKRYTVTIYRSEKGNCIFRDVVAYSFTEHGAFHLELPKKDGRIVFHGFPPGSYDEVAIDIPKELIKKNNGPNT